MLENKKSRSVQDKTTFEEKFDLIDNVSIK